MADRVYHIKDISQKKAKVKTDVIYTEFDSLETGIQRKETVYTFMRVPMAYMRTAYRDYLIRKYNYQFIVVDEVYQKDIGER